MMNEEQPMFLIDSHSRPLSPVSPTIDIAQNLSPSFLQAQALQAPPASYPPLSAIPNRSVAVSSSSAPITYAPHVEEAKTPQLGMAFSSIDEAFNFYNTYAKDAGFSVRKSSNRMLSGEIVWKRFVCHKEGRTDDKIVIKNGIVQRRHLETREDCHAQLQVTKDKSGVYKISKFVPEHSHAVSTPRKRHLLRSHRIVTDAKKELVKTYNSVNIRRSTQMSIFAAQSGGYENAGFIYKDIQNLWTKHREETRGQDAQMLYKHFKTLKEAKPGFIFNIEKDEEDRITHVFWASDTFRKSYGVFGDVVSFDTTYKTNLYELVFGAFTGVNHHGQTIIFGCGLLGNETFDSFVWLFNRWVEAMPGGPPKAMITDQDKAMSKAIKFVMPNTCHRYCLWHILDKLPMKLGAHALQKVGLLEKLKYCIYKSETPMIFEIEWNAILKEYDMKNNDWLNELFIIREKWVPTYLKHVFFAGMSTTQRSESLNSFLKQYVSSKSTLYDFILRFEQGVARQKERERKAQHDNINGKPKLKSHMPMEKQMAEIYTRKIFYQFQEELMMMMSYQLQLEKDDGVESCYIVVNLDDEKEIHRTIVLKKEGMLASCTCRMLEFEGIPCRHILHVLRQAGNSYLPQHYILKRWTKHARGEQDGSEIIPTNIWDESLVARHSYLSSSATTLIDNACILKEASNYVRDLFAEANRKVRDMIHRTNEGTLTRENRKKEKMHVDELQYRNPQHVVTKGRGKRLKSSKEKAITKPRICRGCNQRGVSHDKRNCPERLKRCMVDSIDKARISLEHNDDTDMTMSDTDGELN